MNADIRLTLFIRTYDALGKGNGARGKCHEKHSAKKLLTCGASYKPPALPGDAYSTNALGAWGHHNEKEHPHGSVAVVNLPDDAVCQYAASPVC